MKCVKEDMQKINGKSEILHLITYIKCLDLANKADSTLQEKIANNITFTFQPDSTINQTMSIMSGLGQINVKQQTGRGITTDEKPTQAEPEAQKPSSSSSKQPDKVNPTSVVNDPDQMGPVCIPSKKPEAGNLSSDDKKSFPVSSSFSLPDHRIEEGAVNKPNQVSSPNKVIKIKTEYSVKMKSDQETCCISGICETTAGELIITDWENKKVKLLDQTYKVVTHCDLPDTPLSICSIDSVQVAVTLHNKQVHIIKVTKLRKWHLVHDKILMLQHACQGIAHHKGRLYITSNTALYHYTVDGTQMMKMYENNSDGRPGNAFTAGL
ncbi:hypothetical protein DPMN_117846 [Dreissena polymorpha]|uniref:Uncharacterized protein n=1 Tax=Dreissena polymorpha TaxID=45954 RepID=A0A9D4GM21_DREPO|nr:hypothetical protein DPMN_117846 [Dreissena polymorpha]